MFGTAGNPGVMSPCAILVDLDGTLVDSNERVSAGSARAISAASRLVPVALASGRVGEEVGHYARLLGLRTPQIADNGGTLLDPLAGRILEDSPIDRADSEAIIAEFERSGVSYFASDSGRTVRDRKSFSTWRLTVITGHLAGEMEAMAWADRPIGRGVSAIPSRGYNDEWYINYTRAGTDKGSGARRFAELAGVSLEGVMAIGDGANDVAMFEAVGIPIVMGHASEEVKKRGVRVVGGIDSDGVAEAIEELLLRAARAAAESDHCASDSSSS